MRGAIRIATFANIPVRLHWSFGLLVLWIVMIAVANQLDLAMAGMTIAIIALVFSCVVLHEYGHALAARRYGVVTRDILLTPIGGIARMERMPRDPGQEFVIAIAGPLVNVAIALVIYISYVLIVGQSIPLLHPAFWSFEVAQPLSFIILKLNIILFAFNLIPAFPMDGGRILRSLLSMVLERVTATQVAAIFGQILAIWFMLYAFFPALQLPFMQGSIVLSFIGIFIFMSARREYISAKNERRFKGKRVADVLETRFSLISKDRTVEMASHQIPPGSVNVIIVVNDQNVPVGIIEKIPEFLTKEDGSMPLETYANPKMGFADSTLKLHEIYQLAKLRKYDHILLVENGRVKGVISGTALEAV